MGKKACIPEALIEFLPLPLVGEMLLPEIRWVPHLGVFGTNVGEFWKGEAGSTCISPSLSITTTLPSSSLKVRSITSSSSCAEAEVFLAIPCRMTSSTSGSVPSEDGVISRRTRFGLRWAEKVEVALLELGLDLDDPGLEGDASAEGTETRGRVGRGVVVPELDLGTAGFSLLGAGGVYGMYFVPGGTSAMG